MESMPSTGTSDPMLTDRRVAVGLSGGIACYKVATLVSRLVQCQAQVRVVMTDSAARFIGPLTLQSLSGRPVLGSIWQVDAQPEAEHISLARWCELLIIAPASANTISRITHGISDNVVTLVAAALPRSTPLLLAPAMNEDMWANPITRRNLESLEQTLGVVTVGPESGWQACRTSGPGRMSEPEKIFEQAIKLLDSKSEQVQT